MPVDRARPTVALLADASCATVVLLFGLWAAEGNAGSLLLGATALIVVATATAAVARHAPAVALVVIWTVALLQFEQPSAAFGCALAIAVVAYRTARYGSPATLWAGGLSVPVAAVVAAVIALRRPRLLEGERALVQLVRGSNLGVVTGFLAVTALLAAPYALGLAARINARYRQARADREVAEARAAVEHDLAQARADQTRLTRDVHDIVGHSLAVIVAQADSAQARAADDSVRTALARIASVARSSLAEVRSVLASTQDAAGEVRASTPDLDELVAGVRAAGNDVHETVVGTAVALDDTAGAVAYRVLQEMLTNSLKHGAPGGRIDVERRWGPDGLTLRVANPRRLAERPGDCGGDGSADGIGLANLRSRLDTVGGTLQVAPGARFVTTAHLPSREPT